VDAVEKVKELPMPLTFAVHCEGDVTANVKELQGVETTFLFRLAFVTLTTILLARKPKVQV
jgi:hypothetical protein